MSTLQGVPTHLVPQPSCVQGHSTIRPAASVTENMVKLVSVMNMSGLPHIICYEFPGQKQCYVEYLLMIKVFCNFMVVILAKAPWAGKTSLYSEYLCIPRGGMCWKCRQHTVVGHLLSRGGGCNVEDTELVSVVGSLGGRRSHISLHEQESVLPP